MTADMTTEEYQSLTRSQKVKKVLPKVLPLLLLSVILPTADVGTDFVLINKLYAGGNFTCLDISLLLDNSVYTHNDWKDYEQCEEKGADKYCSNQTNNQNVCSGSHPKIASSLLFFFLLNYIIGLVTCIRLEGRKWLPLIAAFLNVYPQYCKFKYRRLKTVKTIRQISKYL